MAKAKKEQVVEKATEEKVETRMATEDGKIKVKLPKKPKQLSKKDDIVNFVKRNKMVDTQQMSDYLGWGKQIGFRRYRNYLRTVDGLYTTMINKKEYYVYNENFATLQRTIQ